MKKYNSPEVEIMDASDVVTTSPETEKIPVGNGDYEGGAYNFG